MSIKFPTTSNALYGSGPAVLADGGVQEVVKRDAFPGVNYHLTTLMGKRRPPAAYVQNGTLITTTATSMATLKTGIQNNVGSTGTLKDNYGSVYSDVTLVAFFPGPRFKRGSQVHCDYVAYYDQAGG